MVLTYALRDTDPDLVLRSALATLPLSLRPVADGEIPDVAILTAHAGDDSADASPTRLVIGHEPTALQARAGRPGAFVTALPWSANAAMRTASEWASTAERYRIEALATLGEDSPLADALLDQMTVAEALAGRVSELRIISWRADGYIAAAVFDDGVRGILSAVRSSVDAGGLRATLFTMDGDVSVDLPDWTDARPAVVSRTTPTGIETAPMVWETSMREALRRAISGDADDAASVLHRCELVSTAIGRAT